MDKAADQRIDEIQYRSEDFDGIDRQHEEFRNQISHVENGYGDIHSAKGRRDGLRQGMTRSEMEAELEVELDYEEEENKPLGLLRVLRTVLERLQIIEN